MRSVARIWNTFLIWFADITGFAPSGRAFALVLAAGAMLAVLLGALALLSANPRLNALYRNRGFGPQWQCDQSIKGTVCFRHP